MKQSLRNNAPERSEMQKEWERNGELYLGLSTMTRDKLAGTEPAATDRGC